MTDCGIFCSMFRQLIEQCVLIEPQDWKCYRTAVRPIVARKYWWGDTAIPCTRIMYLVLFFDFWHKNNWRSKVSTLLTIILDYWWASTVCNSSAVPLTERIPENSRQFLFCRLHKFQPERRSGAFRLIYTPVPRGVWGGAPAEIGFSDKPKNLTSGSNSYKDFPKNQLTELCALVTGKAN